MKLNLNFFYIEIPLQYSKWMTHEHMNTGSISYHKLRIECVHGTQMPLPKVIMLLSKVIERKPQI